MKKSFTLEIKNPCDANLEQMKPTHNGFYCSSCTKNVIDLSNKTNAEIAKIISETKDKNNICARLRTSQLEQQYDILEIEKRNNIKYAMAVAASVLLTTGVVAQDKTQPNTEQTEPVKNIKLMGKIAYRAPSKKNITFVIKGRVLDSSTNKPLSEKEFSNLTIFISGTTGAVNINPKTGEYSTTIVADQYPKDLNISINSGEKELSKTIPLNTKAIRNKELNQNIIVNPKEFQLFKIAGGLGVIITDKK